MCACGSLKIPLPALAQMQQPGHTPRYQAIALTLLYTRYNVSTTTTSPPLSCFSSLAFIYDVDLSLLLTTSHTHTRVRINRWWRKCAKTWFRADVLALFASRYSFYSIYAIYNEKIYEWRKKIAPNGYKKTEEMNALLLKLKNHDRLTSQLK